MDALIMAGQLILGLTILVGLHELGHMLTAKWFGMRVEKFAIGFPPKVVSKQIGETEYMIGAIPLGGFVKISGMVDESLDTAALSSEPEPHEFRAKPAWQRLIVMMGGIIVNVLTGILIFTIITYNYGESYLPASEARYGVLPNDLGQQMGFQTGDKIVKINGKPFQNFDEIYDQDVLLSRGGYYTVERNGQLVDIQVPVDLMDHMADKNDARFVETIFPFEVGQVVPQENAAKAGLATGDKFVSVNGKPTPYFHEFQAALKENAGKTVPMVVNRSGQEKPLNVQIDEDGKIGFAPVPLLKFATKEYGLLEAIPV
ncbi:MAG TPA: RIP metalloprotease RseP, partial [Adhaeribacter sp.]|nr:RIP metalloprotease RseP [Adhaeribacter sp.]